MGASPDGLIECKCCGKGVWKWNVLTHIVKKLLHQLLWTITNSVWKRMMTMAHWVLIKDMHITIKCKHSCLYAMWTIVTFVCTFPSEKAEPSSQPDVAVASDWLVASSMGWLLAFASELEEFITGWVYHLPTNSGNKLVVKNVWLLSNVLSRNHDPWRYTLWAKTLTYTATAVALKKELW